jgi:hypothetical protein
VIKYVQPAGPMKPDAKPELVTTTVKAYDLEATGQAMRGLFVVSCLQLSPLRATKALIGVGLLISPRRA